MIRPNRHDKIRDGIGIITEAGFFRAVQDTAIAQFLALRPL